MYNYKHAWKNYPEYAAWIRLNRLDIPVYESWRWHKCQPVINNINFFNFLSFVGKKNNHDALIRLDKRNGYVPGNVRWGTHAESNQHRGPYRKFSYSRDEELIAELERRGYGVTSQKLRG